MNFAQLSSVADRRYGPRHDRRLLREDISQPLDDLRLASPHRERRGKRGALLTASEFEPAAKKEHGRRSRDVVVPVTRIGASRYQSDHYAGISPLDLASRLRDPERQLATIRGIYENDPVPIEIEPVIL